MDDLSLEEASNMPTPGQEFAHAAQQFSQARTALDKLRSVNARGFSGAQALEHKLHLDALHAASVAADKAYLLAAWRLERAMRESPYEVEPALAEGM